MRLFGLTGGIGMGKSAAAELLRTRGCAVVDTDEIARELVDTGSEGLREIQKAFGSHYIDEKGMLRRGALAELVFSDPKAREKLENILHPRIETAWKDRVRQWRIAQLPMGVVVIPLLFEKGLEKEFDSVIAIGCAPQTQKERLTSRGWSPVEIERRLASQIPSEVKLARADFVVWSEGSLSTHQSQLDRILSVAA